MNDNLGCDLRWVVDGKAGGSGATAVGCTKLLWTVGGLGPFQTISQRRSAHLRVDDNQALA